MQNTYLSLHAKNFSYNLDFNKVKILELEKNEDKRRLVETIHIIKNKKSINFNSDIQNVSKIYQGFFNNLNWRKTFYKQNSNLAKLEFSNVSQVYKQLFMKKVWKKNYKGRKKPHCRSQLIVCT